MALIAMGAIQASVVPVDPLPVRGLHFGAPSSQGLAKCVKFIREALPKEGVNTLVVEFDYRYRFQSHPEVVDAGALSKDEVRQIADACRDAHIRLIPEMDLLGHQSWAETTFGLLRSHPDFDETPGKFPGNKGLYCRSYCPSDPDVHKVVFDLIDELADACGADAFHVGMDEVQTLGDPDCPRCKGKTTAELFAGEVNALHDHLKEKNRQMWMWGDRFIDGKTSGIGDWEASGNGTQDAIRHVPKDITICDWHYDHAEPTAAYFALNGMPVVACPWRKSDVGTQEVGLVRQIRLGANPNVGQHAEGVMETCWCGADAFIDAYYGRKGANKEAVENAQCFKDVMKAVRRG